MTTSSDLHAWVVDMGMHTGEDTRYYLQCGYRVLAIEADPSLVERAQLEFESPIAEGRLRLIHGVLTNSDVDQMAFYLSGNSLWNSTDRAVSERNHEAYSRIELPALRASDILTSLSDIRYVKMDLEGSDAAVLRDMIASPLRPPFISVESECVREGQDPDAVQSLETLELLYAMGYREFALIDQTTLRPLPLEGGFYTNERMHMPAVKTDP